MFTLSDTPVDGGNDDSEYAPLLGRMRNRRNCRGRVAELAEVVRNKSKEAYTFWTSKTGIGILKCSLAYLIGSMATFVLPIAMLLGRNDSKHMVATVTVWFHPARSVGNMQEAVGIAMIAFIYATVVSFLSMATAILFTHHDLDKVGYIIILVVFLGGGLGFVAWTKQKMGNPLVNVACSLASLTLISVITKEESIQLGTFSIDKHVQYLKMMFLGIVVTAAVSFTARPIFARRDFRTDLVKTTDLLSDLLSMITRAFLSGSEEELKADSYDETAAQYKTAYTSLTKNLSESKWEHYTLGTEKEYAISVRVTKCIETIAQDLRGLRSAASIQFSLVEKTSDASKGHPIAVNATTSSGMFSPTLLTPASLDEGNSMLSSIYEEPEDTPEDASNEGGAPAQRRDSTFSIDNANAPSDIFALFIYNLGPSMKSLAYTLKEVLRELPFDGDRNVNVNSHFRGSLEEANALYTNARKAGLAELYRNRSVTKWRSAEVAADFEEVAASCGYFSSSLQDLAEHTIDYLDTLEELKGIESRAFGKRSWNWLKFWRLFRRHPEEGPRDGTNIHTLRRSNAC